MLLLAQGADMYVYVCMCVCIYIYICVFSLALDEVRRGVGRH